MWCDVGGQCLQCLCMVDFVVIGCYCVVECYVLWFEWGYVCVVVVCEVVQVCDECVFVCVGCCVLDYQCVVWLWFGCIYCVKGCCEVKVVLLFVLGCVCCYNYVMILYDFIFVFGGVCLGKSVYVEWFVVDSGCCVIYIVIVIVVDVEFVQCIVYYCVCWLVEWGFVDVFIDFVGMFVWFDDLYVCLFVDCLMLWFMNLLCFVDGELFDDVYYVVQVEWFEYVLCGVCVKVIVVSNEIGFGVVLFGLVMCCYVDEFGCLNQCVVVFVMCVMLLVVGLLFDFKVGVWLC